MKNLLLSVALLAACAQAEQVAEVKVKALDGFGGDAGSVASRCQTKAGAEYDPVTVTRDVNALKSSGEFEEITADAVKGFSGDVDVVFYVKRKVRFQAPLKVDGNEFFSESKVAKEAGLSDGALYGEAVKNVAGVSLLDEFGAAEAVWHFDVVDFRGVVAMDAHGRSLFADVAISSAANLKSLN